MRHKDWRDGLLEDLKDPEFAKIFVVESEIVAEIEERVKRGESDARDREFLSELLKLVKNNK